MMLRDVRVMDMGSLACSSAAETANGQQCRCRKALMRYNGEQFPVNESLSHVT
jgi:hypothetical protein